MREVVREIDSRPVWYVKPRDDDPNPWDPPREWGELPDQEFQGLTHLLMTDPDFSSRARERADGLAASCCAAALEDLFGSPHSYIESLVTAETDVLPGWEFELLAFLAWPYILRFSGLPSAISSDTTQSFYRYVVAGAVSTAVRFAGEDLSAPALGKALSDRHQEYVVVCEIDPDYWKVNSPRQVAERVVRRITPWGRSEGSALGDRLEMSFFSHFERGRALIYHCFSELEALVTEPEDM
jgi:hypothetical protein